MTKLILKQETMTLQISYGEIKRKISCTVENTVAT